MNEIVSAFVAGADCAHTRRCYEAEAGRLLGAWGATPSRPSVLAWRASLAPLAPSTRVWKVGVAKRLLRMMEAAGLADAGLATLIPPARATRLPVRAVLTPNEARTILARPAKTPKQLRDRAVLAVMLGCGLRAGEMCSLTTDDLTDDTDGWSLLRVRGKGGHYRLVRVRPEVMATIRQAGAVQRVRAIPSGSRPLFTFRDRPLRYQAVYRLVRSALRRAGIAAHVTPHGLRATFATLALRGGADVRSVQAALGHANLETTARYLAEDDARHNPTVERNLAFATP